MKHLNGFFLKKNSSFGFDRVIYEYQDFSDAAYVVNSNNLVRVLKKVYEKRSNEQ